MPPTQPDRAIDREEREGLVSPLIVPSPVLSYIFVFSL